MTATRQSLYSRRPNSVPCDFNLAISVLLLRPVQSACARLVTLKGTESKRNLLIFRQFARKRYAVISVARRADATPENGAGSPSLLRDNSEVMGTQYRHG